jgi:hypothetical protein
MATPIGDEIDRYRRQCQSRVLVAVTPEEAQLWRERTPGEDGKVRARAEEELKDGAFMMEFGRLIGRAAREERVSFE